MFYNPEEEQKQAALAIAETKKVLRKLNQQYIKRTMRENAETTANRKLNDLLRSKGCSMAAMHEADKYWLKHIDNIYSDTPIKLS